MKTMTLNRREALKLTAVTVGDRHALIATHPGHAPMAYTFYGPATGLTVSLPVTTRLRVDPARPIRVSEQGIELAIAPNHLVDAAGKRPTGLLNLDLYRYDVSKGELPGDTIGLSTAGLSRAPRQSRRRSRRRGSPAPFSTRTSSSRHAAPVTCGSRPSTLRNPSTPT